MASFVYVTGVPGVGKSTVLRELRRIGHGAIGIDEDGIGAFFRSDGTIVLPDDVVDSPQWRAKHKWRIVPDRLDEHDERYPGRVFVCGSAANEADVWPKFTTVVALIVDESTVRDRLGNRAGNNFGKSEDELELALRWHRTYENDMRCTKAILLNAKRPVADIVEELLAVTDGSVR